MIEKVSLAVVNIPMSIIVLTKVGLYLDVSMGRDGSF